MRWWRRASCSNMPPCSAIATARPRRRSRRRLPPAATSSPTSTGRAPSSSAKACATTLSAVFVLPPSIEALELRLRQRAQDSAAVVAERMAKIGRRNEPLVGIRIRHRQPRHRGERRRGPGDRHRRSACAAADASASPISSTACARGERRFRIPRLKFPGERAEIRDRQLLGASGRRDPRPRQAAPRPGPPAP